MSSNTSKLSISPPNTFQHVGGSNINKPPSLQTPPPPLKVSTNSTATTATATTSINNNTIESPPKSPNIPPQQPQLVKSTSNNNIAPNGTANGHLKKSTSNHNLNINVNSNSNTGFGGSLHANQPNKILHHPSPKKTTKSTIISGKLKRFFKSRPTRNSLYEKHILSAPFSSATLSFINIFKIITALKKSNAIEAEGLFRVNGNAESIRSLWLMLNNVQEAIPADQNSSPHDLAGLLKLYLRESKFPLIPLELFTQPTLPSTIDDAREFVEQKLPTENVRVLSYLVEYLEQVSLKSSLNKMNPIALGVCFAPNTLRSVNMNPVNPQFQVHMTNIQSHCNFITLLIENRSKIFKEAALPPSATDGCSNDDEILSTLIIQSPSSTNNDQDLDEEDDENDSYNDDENINNSAIESSSTSLDHHNNLESDGTQSPSQKEISPLYDEFINLLTDDSLGPSQKSVIIQRMTTLFSTDGDRFKAFLRDMQIDGIISLLEYILTLDEN